MLTTELMLRSTKALLLAASVLTLPGTVLADAGHSHGAAIGEPAKASATTRTVEVNLGDNYYEPETVQVKAGEIVRFVLINEGELLHEFNIGTAAMHAEHQKEMPMMMDHGILTPTGIGEKMTNMDHLNMGGGSSHSMKHDNPNSVLVEPGKTKELVWKFTQATDLEFACNMPGHYETGMVGSIDFRH